MASAFMCAALNEMEESPWGGWRDGKGIDPITLAGRLRVYDVKPGNVRLPDGSTPKGYMREKFTDCWDRYCPSESPADPPHRHNPHGERDPGVADDLSANPTRHGENPHDDCDVALWRVDTRHNGAGRILSDEDVAQNEEYAARFRRRAEGRR